MTKSSSRKINSNLVADLLVALQELGGWGSLEIYVQNGRVTQITRRVIKKTNHSLKIGT